MNPTPRSIPNAASDPTASRQVNLNDGDLTTPLPLDTFMNELGVIMQLPRKTTATQAIPVVAESVAPRRRRGLLLPFIAVVLAGCVWIARVNRPVLPSEVPPQLRGEWGSDHVKYLDKRLAFTSNSVGITSREGSMPVLHRVISIDSTSSDDTLRVAVTYDDDGTATIMNATFVKWPRRRLELSNPPGVYWWPVVEERGGGATRK